MFHWTDQRIEGHICLCYIAYTFQIYLSNQLKKNNTPLSENQIRKALDHMQLSLIDQAGQQYYLRSTQTAQAGDILRVLGAKPLPDMFHNDQIVRYL